MCVSVMYLLPVSQSSYNLYDASLQNSCSSASVVGSILFVSMAVKNNGHIMTWRTPAVSKSGISRSSGAIVAYAYGVATLI